jgi:membrane protein involved in colicin uptake
VDATVAVAVLTPPRELEAPAEAEVARKAAAHSKAEAAMLAAVGEKRNSESEFAADIAEVEAEAARRVAVSSSACERAFGLDFVFVGRV